jgi:pyrroline-5-carboxylate reductase
MAKRIDVDISNLENMSTTIGIIGIGAIAEAVVMGLCKKAESPKKILLSPRNKQRAEQLAKRFSNVEIARDNQAVISASDIVFLAVRPQVVEDVLRELSFKAEQRVVSFISGYPIKQLEGLIEPTKHIVRMIPLPAIARHEGPILMSPPSQEIAKLFQEMGSLAQVEQEDQLEILSAVTGLMAPYFGLLDQCVDWLSTNGIDESKAFDFVGALFEVLGRTPRDSTEKDFSKVAKEHATPQGFNEQALRELTKIGWYGDVSEVLDLLSRRLAGKARFEDGVK